VKKLITFAVLTVTVAVLGCSSGLNAAKENKGSDKPLGIYNVRQLVAADNKTGRTIMWHSKASKRIMSWSCRQKIVMALRFSRLKTLPLRMARENIFNTEYILML